MGTACALSKVRGDSLELRTPAHSAAQTLLQSYYESLAPRLASRVEGLPVKKRTNDLITICIAGAVGLYAFGTLIPARAATPEEEAPVEQTEGGEEGEEEMPTVSDALIVNTPEYKAREEYIATWGERIDAFNAGYPLEGHGRTFAEAAYDNGIDPRFSPAIARIESSSGEHCFLPHNAWGWGDVSWPDWDTAIREHVAGLAEGYGYTLTYRTAEVYNQVYVDQWYAWVDSCMTEIWPTDEL